MKNFEDYLKTIHMKKHPEILDDDLPDAFDSWLSDLQADDFIDYAGRWGIYIHSQMMKDIRKLDFEISTAIEAYLRDRDEKNISNNQ